MTTPTQASLDLTSLLTEAARVFVEDPASGLDSGPLARLAALAVTALDAEASLVLGLNDDSLLLAAAGQDQAPLRETAQKCLTDWCETQTVRHSYGGEQAVMLLSGETPIGVWAVTLRGKIHEESWQTVSAALSPFFVMGLRQIRWQQEIAAAQTMAEKRIREVATVYEIGQAMDKVEIDRLLDLITEKAAAVMDAQACSLMLKLPDANSLVIAAAHGLPDEVVENTRIFVGEGIAGRVAATGEPLRLNSLADDPRFKDSPVQGVPGITSSLCMPMKDENGNVQGVLCIRRRDPSPCFTEEDQRLFSIFANQAALAINNAQLYAKLNHKLQELSTLAALTETINSTLDLDQVLNQVADNIVDVVHFDRCRIYLFDPETGRFSPRIVRGFRWNTPGEQEPSFEMGEGVIGTVAQRQMPLLVEDRDSTSPPVRDYALALGMDSFYAQPIIARGRCIGVVVVSNTGLHRPIGGSSTELLSLFVHQAGIAIENARFYTGQERRYAELTTLYEVSKTLAATSGIQKAARTVNDLATQITDSDAGILLLFDAGQEGLSALHWRGVGEDMGKRLRSFIVPVPVPSDARRLRSPRLLYRHDVEAFFGPEWQPLCEEFVDRHRATALVPLTVDDAPVGFLLLGKQGTAFGDEELKLISVASSQAAAVLSSARSYERRIGQRELELSAIYELMQKVRLATTLDDALNSILDIVASLVWSDESSLLTVDEGGETMTVRAARGPKALTAIGREALPLDGNSIAARALRERAALISSDLATRGMGDEDAAEAGVSRSLMAIPLVVGDELIGVLSMQSKTPDLYTEESVKMLHLVASQAATIYREMTSLRTLTRYTENILRSIPAGVITVDKNGYIVTWNKRAEEIVNLSAHEIIGRHYSEFILMLQVDSHVREETMRMVELTAQTGKVFTRNQMCYHTSTSEETYVNLSASQLRSESGEYLGVVVVFEDVTNEVHTKEELERVSKLAETGQLAANIAHELRNPLSSIKGAAQLLRNELPPNTVTQHGEFLDIIIEEVNGLNRITTEFLEFSRVTPPEMQTISVNAMVSRLLQFMNTYLQDNNVHLLLALDEDLPDVFMDKSQIEQVLRNIVINAVQSMPHGGTLTVGTRYFEASDIAELAIMDTGVGIPAAKIEKIFAPFFTTKTKGTGLGLAIARKIVETHGGRLSVQSTPGDGSTFTIHLPVHPLQANVIPQSRLEIADQRSDQPGEMYEIPAALAG